MIHDGLHDHEGINGIPQGMKNYPKKSLGFHTMSTYKLLIYLIQCILERMWLKHYDKYWMEGVRKKRLSTFAMKFKKPTMQ